MTSGKRNALSQRRAAPLLVTLSALLLSLGLCEMLSRAFFSPPPKVISSRRPDYSPLSGKVTRPNGKPVKSPGRWYQTPLFYPTEKGVRMRPNTRVHLPRHWISGRSVSIRTNSFGYRNPEIREKPNGTLRFLFLGNSITFSGFLPEDETFVRRIEAIAAKNGLSWETINAGIDGVALKNELALLRESGIATQPDAVVVEFYLNDHRESRGLWMPSLPRWIRWSQLANLATVAGIRLVSSFRLGTRIGNSLSYRQHHARWELWREAFEKRFETCDGDYRTSPCAFNRRILWAFKDWGGTWSEGAWDHMLPLFEEMARLSKKHKFALAFVAFPVKHQVEADYVYDFPQKKLAATANKLHVPMLDLLPILREQKKVPCDSLFFDQCHLTPVANEIVSNAVFRFLEKTVVSEIQ